MYFWLIYCDKDYIEWIPTAVENIGHLFDQACQIMKANRLHLFLLSEGTRIDEDECWSLPRRRHRINCLHRRTNPEIVDLFWIKTIFKPQKQLLSIKHWLFYMKLGRFPAAAFSK